MGKINSNLKFKRKSLPNQDFTIMYNGIIFDKEVSYQAAGMFLQICAVPKRNFVISIDKLVGYKRNGRSSVMAIIKELEQHGYITREPNYIQDEKGVRRSYDTYVIDDDPKGILDQRREKDIEEECW